MVTCWLAFCVLHSVVTALPSLLFQCQLLIYLLMVYGGWLHLHYYYNYDTDSFFAHSCALLLISQNNSSKKSSVSPGLLSPSSVIVCIQVGNIKCVNMITIEYALLRSEMVPY